MKKNVKLGFASAIVINGINKLKNIFKAREVKPNHLKDLEDRLQNVANRATYKGDRNRIGSIKSLAQQLKESQRKRNNDLRHQFSGAIVDGKNEFYLKDGVMVAR